MANSTTFTRVRGILAFLIGIFGALAILGVFFKIMKISNYELFMKIGFIGEAGAFVVMGVIELMTSFSQKGGAEVARGRAEGGAPFESSLSTLIDAKLDTKLDEILIHLAGDVDRFRSEMGTLSSELSQSSGAVRGMRAQLESVASADLANDAHTLGQGMAQLGAEMEAAGSAVESIRADLELMVHRFRAFNGIQAASDHPALGHRGRRAS